MINPNLFNHRFIYQNLPTPEKPSAENHGAETLSRLSKMIEDSYKQQLLMMNNINETLAPVQNEINRHNQIIATMQKHFAEYPQLEAFFRIEGVSGAEIITLMTKDGTYQEYLNDQPVNFIAWLRGEAIKNRPHN